MITQLRFNENLQELKNRIPIKPEEYTTDHPKRIREGLLFYCRQRSLGSLQMANLKLIEENWPMPLWFDPDDIKVGFWNKLYFKMHFQSWKKRLCFRNFRAFEYLSVPLVNSIFFKISYEDTILEAFKANYRYLFRELRSNPLLVEKYEILSSIEAAYRRKNWVACLSTTFPLLDFISRKVLKTKDLRKQVNRIINLFLKAGYNQHNATQLMPSAHFAWLEMQARKEQLPFDLWSEIENHRDMFDFDLGIIGAALSSFIYFGSIYYGYYTEHDNDVANLSINRHAIVHGSANSFGTEANVVKMLSFLYLVLELEEVFEILLTE